MDKEWTDRDRLDEIEARIDREAVERRFSSFSHVDLRALLALARRVVTPTDEDVGRVERAVALSMLDDHGTSLVPSACIRAAARAALAAVAKGGEDGK